MTSEVAARANSSGYGAFDLWIRGFRPANRRACHLARGVLRALTLQSPAAEARPARGFAGLPRQRLPLRQDHSAGAGYRFSSPPATCRPEPRRRVSQFWPLSAVIGRNARRVQYNVGVQRGYGSHAGKRKPCESDAAAEATPDVGMTASLVRLCC